MQKHKWTQLNKINCLEGQKTKIKYSTKKLFSRLYLRTLLMSVQKSKKVVYNNLATQFY